MFEQFVNNSARPKTMVGVDYIPPNITPTITFFVNRRRWDALRIEDFSNLNRLFALTSEREDKAYISRSFIIGNKFVFNLIAFLVAGARFAFRAFLQTGRMPENRIIFCLARQFSAGMLSHFKGN